MHKNPLGCAISLTEYNKTKKLPAALCAAGGVCVFISLHIEEEFCSSYTQQVKDLCALLCSKRARILADVSPKTLEIFKMSSFFELKQTLGLWALRIDDGLTPQEIADLANTMPIVVNASTICPDDAQLIVQSAQTSSNPLVYAMHNFYPRPLTGLDSAFFDECNDTLKRLGMHIMAFIPADKVKRIPLREGLPTLEHQRTLSPYVSFAQMNIRYAIDEVFCADPEISSHEQALIDIFIQQDMLVIPAELHPGYEYLYRKIFTCRKDSPSWLVRFEESRQYASDQSKGSHCIEPFCTTFRKRGCITMDNKYFMRYQGEIELLRNDFPADTRVNVIGRVDEHYVELIDLIGRGTRFMLVSAQ